MTNTDQTTSRVADATPDNWVYRWLPRAAWPYAQLARLDRPIGWQLLMWPCFWSAGMAANVTAAAGSFSLLQFVAHLFLFFVGAVVMRGAGCTYNDLIDHEIDAKVARTRSRPLPSGRATRKQAKIFMVAQALVGLVVLLQFNTFSIVLGIASLAVVALYPFAKRFTDWPQFFLGLAFSWGALMGWAAVLGRSRWPQSSCMSLRRVDDRLRLDLRASGQGGRCTHRCSLHRPAFRREYRELADCPLRSDAGASGHRLCAGASRRRGLSRLVGGRHCLRLADQGSGHRRHGAMPEALPLQSHRWRHYLRRAALCYSSGLTHERKRADLQGKGRPKSDWSPL